MFIPHDDQHLIKAKDKKNGLFIICKCCTDFHAVALQAKGKRGRKGVAPGTIESRRGRPFTLSSWNNHKSSMFHTKALEAMTTAAAASKT